MDIRVQIDTPAVLLLCKEPRYSLTGSWLGDTQNRTENLEENKFNERYSE